MSNAGRVITRMCVLVLAFSCALSVAVARAGTYEVAICHDPDSGASAPADGVSFPTAGAYVFAGVYQSCGATGYLYADLDGVAPHGPSDFASWIFQAPPATTIVTSQAYQSFSVGPVMPFQAPLAELDTISSAGSASVLAWCTQSFGCSASGTGPLTEFAPANLLAFSGLANVMAIEGTAACGGGQTCAAGAGAYCPELGGDPCIASDHLYAMVVTLEDDTAPVGGDLSGSLVAPGTLSGVAGVSFDATDTGSGLYSAALAVDGTQVATTQISSNGGHCVAIEGPGSIGAQTGPLRFDWSVPCALSGAGTLELDTSTLKDGAHGVAVTVSDAAGNTSTIWSGTIHTANAPTGGSPLIVGDVQQGHTLFAGTGVWTPAPSGYSYQWERCDAAGTNCVAIAGATAATYAVSAADDYRQLAVAVTASNADGSTSALSPVSGVVLDANGYASAPPAPALDSGSLPTLSGTAREGDMLSAQAGDWGGGPLSYAYQWQRCDSYGLGCAAITGAVGATYRLAAADDYARVRVLVSATGPGGSSEAASEPSALIADASGSTVAPESATTPPDAPVTQGVANGIGACGDARLHATIGGSSSVTIALRRSVMLRGALDCGGAPVRQATVDLAITAAAAGAPAHEVRVRTDAGGTFSYLVGPGPSRRIALSYSEYTPGGTPSAKASVEVLVTPAISLSIEPTRTFNGRTITFSGRVSGGDEPRAGLPLDLEYLEGSQWMIYTLVAARPGDGRFLYRYTFRRTTQSITYAFRVAIPSTGVSGYPYQPTTSPVRRVHVDP